MIVNVIAALIIAACLAAAITYMVRAKKRGVKCIGCSAGGCCSGGNHKHEGECCCGAHEKSVESRTSHIG